MSSFKTKKHLFFDLDDTLWDFEKNSALVLKDLFLEYDLENKLVSSFDDFLAEYKKVNLLFWSLYNRRQIDKEYLRNNRFYETFKKFGYDNYTENLVLTEHYLARAPHGKNLKAGCLEILNYLKPNYNLHIITNGFKEIQAIKIDGCGLRDYFKHIIISEEHQLSKPDEKIFRLAESFSNAKSNDCVMIGDNFESDVQGAQNAGWEAIHLSPEPVQGYIGQSIASLRELRNLF